MAALGDFLEGPLWPITLKGILALNDRKRRTRDVPAGKANSGGLLRQSRKYQFSTGGASSKWLAELPSLRVAGCRRFGWPNWGGIRKNGNPIYHQAE